MSTLSEVLTDLYGDDVRITGTHSASGGSINRTSVVTLSDGQKLFVKSNDNVPSDFFEAEKDGLLRMAATKKIRVPDPIACFSDGATRYLILEYLDSAPPAADHARQLGWQLAELHHCARSRTWGLDTDNYIGRTPQRNRPDASWIHFFCHARLAPQIAMAAAAGLLDDGLHRELDRLVDRLPELLIEPAEEPTLIHGDLWSGNVMSGPSGEPVLIDPAVYFGHREADLAMTELFGRQPRKFYDAYSNVWPLEPGYGERRDLYNLYHLLNHLNLFGGGYAGNVRATVRRYL